MGYSRSINTYEAGAREKALDHFGSEEMFHAHWTSDELYDQVKCCGIHEEKQEPHLAPMLLESLLRVLSEDKGADQLYQTRVRRFLVNFLEIHGKPTDLEIRRHVHLYEKEWE